MKTVNKTIETINGKVKIQYQIEYTNWQVYGKEESAYNGYGTQDVHIVFNGKDYFLKLKSYWNAKRTLVIYEYSINNVVLSNEKQILEYIYRIENN